MCIAETERAFGILGVPQCPAHKECRRRTSRHTSTVGRIGNTTGSVNASRQWSGKGQRSGSKGIALQPLYHACRQSRRSSSCLQLSCGPPANSIRSSQEVRRWPQSCSMVFNCVPLRFTELTPCGRQGVAEPPHAALHAHFCLICSASRGYVFTSLRVKVPGANERHTVFQDCSSRAKPTENVTRPNSK